MRLTEDLKHENCIFEVNIYNVDNERLGLHLTYFSGEIKYFTDNAIKMHDLAFSHQIHLNSLSSDTYNHNYR